MRARVRIYAATGNAYEVVRKPTITGLYRINLVSSRRMCDSLSVAITACLACGVFHRQCYLAHIYDGREACKGVRIRASGEKPSI